MKVFFKSSIGHLLSIHSGWKEVAFVKDWADKNVANMICNLTSSPKTFFFVQD